MYALGVQTVRLVLILRHLVTFDEYLAEAPDCSLLLFALQRLTVNALTAATVFNMTHNIRISAGLREFFCDLPEVTT